jgi:ComF family protein
MTVLVRIASDLLHLIFPERCNACGQGLVRGEKVICLCCLQDLPYTDYHLHRDNKAAKQFWGRLPCELVVAMLFFKKGSRVQTLIHRLKYKGQTAVGYRLGMLLGERLKQNPALSSIDLILPVPLHKRRLRMRGYNQAEYIAAGIATVLRIPMCSGLLLKPFATDSQTRKGRFSRYENLKSVFQVPDAGKLENKHVLLVDDVITTGATLEACGLALYNSGISKLSIAALAFAE